MHTSMDAFPQYTDRSMLAAPASVDPEETRCTGDTGDSKLVEQAATADHHHARDRVAPLAIYRAWMRKLYSIDIKGRSGRWRCASWSGRLQRDAVAKKRVDTRPTNNALTLGYAASSTCAGATDLDHHRRDELAPSASALAVHCTTALDSSSSPTTAPTGTMSSAKAAKSGQR